MTQEKLGIGKQQAENLIAKHISVPITKLHLIETEAIMRKLAKRFNEDEDVWGMIGLLHDIDWDLTKKEDISQHTVRAVEILKQAGANEFLIESIISHGYGHSDIPEYRNRSRKGVLQHCLAAGETLTGLIVASALVQPDKRLASVKLASLKKKFKQRAFAANCDRDIILECEKAGVPLDEFLEIGLNSLQEISEELGL